MHICFFEALQISIVSSCALWTNIGLHPAADVSSYVVQLATALSFSSNLDTDGLNILAVAYSVIQRSFPGAASGSGMGLLTRCAAAAVIVADGLQL